MKLTGAAVFSCYITTNTYYYMTYESESFLNNRIYTLYKFMRMENFK